MDWKQIHFRHVDHADGKLLDGDVCVVRLDAESNFNYTGFSLAIYYEGEFYDHFVKEDPDMPSEYSCLTNYEGNCIAEEYLNTGENVENISSPIMR